MQGQCDEVSGFQRRKPFAAYKHEYAETYESDKAAGDDVRKNVHAVFDEPPEIRPGNAPDASREKDGGKTFNLLFHGGGI